jgi:hypothetical protein
MANLKSSLSKWLKTQSSGLALFSWQREYDAPMVALTAPLAVAPHQQPE